MRSQLEVAQKRIDDSVSRSEMQAQITDATAAARQVIERLEEKVKSLEEGRDALIVTKDQLHADVQRLLERGRLLREAHDEALVEQRRLHSEEQKRITEAHQAELERLAKVHEREMNEVCKQAIDAQGARDEVKERLEEDLAELRRMMADHDAAIVECAGRLHTTVRGEYPLLLLFIRLA